MSKNEHPTPISMEDMGYIALSKLTKSSEFGVNIAQNQGKTIVPYGKSIFFKVDLGSWFFDIKCPFMWIEITEKENNVSEIVFDLFPKMMATNSFAFAIVILQKYHFTSL